LAAATYRLAGPGPATARGAKPEAAQPQKGVDGKLPGDPAAGQPVVQERTSLAEIEAVFAASGKTPAATEEFRKLMLRSGVPEQTRQMYRTVTADYLRVRSGPHGDAEVVTLLRTGSPVRVLQTQNEWVEVKSPEGIQGWTAKRFLAEIQ